MMTTSRVMALCLLFSSVFLVLVASSPVSVSLPASVSYQLKTVHTLTRRAIIGSSEGQQGQQQVTAAKLRIEWPSHVQAHQLATAGLTLRCPASSLTFDSLQHASASSAIVLVSSGASKASQRAATQMVKIMGGLGSFRADSSPLGGLVSSAYVLLHQLPTAAEAQAAANAAAASESEAEEEFGGWPAKVSPCASSHSSLGGELACCTLQVSMQDAEGAENSFAVPLAPLQLNAETNSPPASVDATVNHAAKRNASELLLEWKRALFDLSSSTPLTASLDASSHLPQHLPPSRSTRRGFLRAALRRRAVIERNARGASDTSRRSAAELGAQHPASEEMGIFVEKSGWSTTALADILSGGMSEGMSPRTQKIVAPTTEDAESVGQLMTDVTTTFLQASEQVKTHLKAGVSARQVIAMVCNKMVLRDMPPKVGLAIVKSLQQAVLNILKETIADQMTQYLVPPDSVGAFVETSGGFKPLTEHALMRETIEQVRTVNPIEAQKLEKVEQERVEAQLDEWRKMEESRLAKVESAVFVEVDANVQPTPASSTNASPATKQDPSSAPVATSSFSSSSSTDPDSNDKYTSFLTTYSAARTRAHSKSLLGISGDAIGQRMKDFLTPMLTHGIIHDASAQTQNFLHVLLHESLSNKLHEEISKSVVEALTPSLTDSVSEAQVGLLSVTLRNQLTREATHHLTKSLTLLLTPALSVILTRSLTRSPHSDYYCHICANPLDDFPEKPAEFHLDPIEHDADPSKPYCVSCDQSKQHDYYLDYYSSYYSRYYSSYFSFYYGDFYARRFHENVMGTCKMQPCEHAL